MEVLRGISSGLGSTGATVATYFDDVPTSPASLASGGQFFTLDPDLFDVARIEVLKGPQGTLFGASSMGGLIRYIFNPPNLEKLEGKMEVGFTGIPDHGTGNSANFALNIPLLTDVLAIRFDLFRRYDPGFIDNVFRHQKDVNDSLSEGGRATMLWTPFDHFRAQLSSYYQRLTVNEFPGEDVQPLTLQPTSGDLETAEKLPQPQYSKWFINNVTLSYDFPWANLLSSTSLERQFTDLNLDDSDVYGELFAPPYGGNAALIRQYDDVKKTTEEVRLTSPSGRTLEWIAGFYYTHEAASLPENIDIYDAVGAADTLLVPNLVTFKATSLYQETAGFGDLTYHLGHSVELQGGFRYSSIAQEYTQPYETFGGAPLVHPLVGNATLDKTTYLGTVRYHLDSNAMLYARVATGYRPGGANVRIPASEAPTTYQSDSLISYELGIKGDLIEHVFDYTADMYRIDWRNIQVEGVDPDTGFGFYDNGGRAHSQGLELAFGYRPLSALRMGLSASFNQARLDEGISVPGATSEKGDELPYAPKIAVTGMLDYTRPLTGTMAGFAGLTVTEVGSRRAYFADQTVGLPALGPQFVSTTGMLPSYTTLDLRGGVELKGLAVTLYVRNVNNARGAVSLNALSTGADLAHATVGPAELTLVQPRSFGMSVRYDF